MNKENVETSINLTVKVLKDGTFFVTSRDAVGFMLMGKTLDDALKGISHTLGVITYLNEDSDIWKHLLTDEKIEELKETKEAGKEKREKAFDFMINGDPTLISDLQKASENNNVDINLLERAITAITLLEGKKITQERLKALMVKIRKKQE